MNIGILVAGPLSDEQVSKYGTLPSMFEQLLGAQDRSLTFRSYQVFKEDFPSSPEECDGWVITGSFHSAYEDLPWIKKLEEFIRETIDKDIPIIGICFGHQIMAQAMGGKVEREANRRWGAAVHEYDLTFKGGEKPEWMSGDVDVIALQASHQDQVVALPPDAIKIGGNNFCPNGLIMYGKRGLSMQLHPELSAEFIESLVVKRRGNGMSVEDADDALSRIHTPVDNDIVAGWMVNFLRQ